MYKFDRHQCLVVLSSKNDFRVRFEKDLVSLGIIDPSERKMQRLPYAENALGLSIKIGTNKDGAENSNTDPIAEIELKNRNN